MYTYKKRTTVQGVQASFCIIIIILYDVSNGNYFIPQDNVAYHRCLPFEQNSIWAMITNGKLYFMYNVKF